MTEKQKNILEIALQLFSKEGFYATSTSKIAKEAGVSEGLIFRHFTNKDGLLKAILKQGEDEMNTLFSPLFNYTDPAELLTKIIEIPFRVSANQHNYWRLIYTLKWQERAYNEISIAPIMALAKEAFASLGYADPEAEVAVLEMILDGAATVILLKNEPFETEATLCALKTKYKLD